MVRLGEYDTSTTEDGEHLDVYIDKTVAHGRIPRWFIDDIGMLYLVKDVVFNGKFWDWYSIEKSQLTKYRLVNPI